MPIERLRTDREKDINQLSQKWYSDTAAMQQIVAPCAKY
jgi:hypothetical protein